MKLIDADKLIEKLSTNLDNPEEFPVISLGAVMRMIDGEEVHPPQPERKKGQWLFNVRGCHAFTCPYCGTHKAFKHNFCSNCGADMRGEENG